MGPMIERVTVDDLIRIADAMEETPYQPTALAAFLEGLSPRYREATEDELERFDLLAFGEVI